MVGLLEAAAHNDLKTVQYFVEQRGINPGIMDNLGQTAAHIAANNGNSQIIKYLLDREPCLTHMKNKWDQTVLHIAVQKCPLELIKYLVDVCKADMYSSNAFSIGGSALHIAAAEGKLDILKYFIKNKEVDANLRDSAGAPPAFVAADNHQLSIIKYLAEETNADLTTTDNKGDNILYLSAKRDDLSISKYLLDELKLHFDINWKNRAGETLVHRAAVYNSLNFMKYVVEEKHADVNIPDENGSTPLHEASSVGLIRMVRYLIKKGADPQVEDKFHKTPLQATLDKKVSEYLEQVTGTHRSRRSAYSSLSIPPLPVVVPYRWIRFIHMENSLIDASTSSAAVPISFGSSIESLLMLAKVCVKRSSRLGYQM